MSQTSFSLTEISQWAESDNKFNLPNVQRGFVWKPYQIEDLWDSIFRGYPIGCFVLSKSKISGREKYEILDGQQRATAIALGFSSKTFLKTEQNIKLFIDLGYSPTIKDDKKYLFRVITRSHPWGYEKADNSKTLDADKKRIALKEYGLESHLDKSLDLFFPFDSTLPVPFFYLLTSESVEDALNKLRDWKLYGKVKQHFLKYNTGFDQSKFEEFLSRNLAQLLQDKNSMLREYPNIPALYLNLDKFINADLLEKEENIGLNKKDEDTNDEIENLFIRLNNHGTPLRGEELNYSILKAHITKDLQNKIERECKHFIRPSKFIAILFRVFSNEPGNKSSGNISLKIKAKVFQRAIAEDKMKFTDYIKTLLEDRIYNGQTLIQYTKNILSYHPIDNIYGFPFTIYAGIAENAPEVMFTLMFRVKVMGDKFNEPNSILHRKMLGTVSLLYWLGKGERNRDHSKILKNIWPSVSLVVDAETFWSKSTLNRAQLNRGLCIFPKFNGRGGLQSFLNARLNGKRSDRDPFLVNSKEEVLLPFINATLYSKDLITFSQRNFLHLQFSPIHYELEDTNVPFDWDHISPQNAIAIRPVPKPIESVYTSIGNLRAWPYSLNRTDQANTPFMKFNPLFDKNKDNLPVLLTEYSRILKADKEIKTTSELKKLLLDVSVCDKEWSNCNAEKLKETKDWKPVYTLIIKRMIKLYQNWYEGLLIDSLHPLVSDISFESLFYKGKWDKNSKNDKLIRNYFVSGDYEFWLSNPVLPDVFLYFGFKRGLGLTDEGFSFGLLEKETITFLNKIKIPEKNKNKYQFIEGAGFCEIQGFFTLISAESSSYRILLSEIYNWIKDFPDKTLRASIQDYILKSLKQENKKYLENSTKNR